MSRLRRTDGRTDERTDGGKWKIGQCSVGPETAKIDHPKELEFIDILHREIFSSKISKYLLPLLHHLANHCPQNRPCLICICSEKGKIFKQKGSK